MEEVASKRQKVPRVKGGSEAESGEAPSEDSLEDGEVRMEVQKDSATSAADGVPAVLQDGAATR